MCSTSPTPHLGGVVVSFAPPSPHQVADIAQLGTPIEVAQLILPRGSTLLATATQQFEQPPKETPLGKVDLPPQTYYS
jgi:hypothetical protein